MVQTVPEHPIMESLRLMGQLLYAWLHWVGGPQPALLIKLTWCIHPCQSLACKLKGKQ